MREYNSKSHPKTGNKPKKKLTKTPLLKLPNGVVSIDNVLYFNREYEYDYENPRMLTIQYKASGIQTSTVILIVLNKFPELNELTIRRWMGYFGRYYTYRKCNGALKRDKWYKEQEIARMSKELPKSDNPFNFNPDNDYVTANQPLINKRGRKRIGSLNKDEKQLLYDIKNKTDYWHINSYLKG
jgi:hypothetical protein